MTEIRCKKCNRLLLKTISDFQGEVKCAKCGYLNLILMHNNGILQYDGNKYGVVEVRTAEVIS
jgi:phage FluMu protein Com